jgi:thiopurine S-methyltransferase
MDAEFWHQKWQRNEIGFHRDKVNPFLVNYLDKLLLTKGDRLFLPLCGKTLDIAWLLSEGYEVVGVELHEPAVITLFDDLGVKPVITRRHNLTIYHHERTCIFVGDIFDLTPDDLGHIDAIYDRAALVALPDLMRSRYAQHLIMLLGGTPQLLISYDYDQSVVKGPPFAVCNDELKILYNLHYDMTLLHHCDVEGGMKGRCPASENVWLLLPNHAFHPYPIYTELT